MRTHLYWLFPLALLGVGTFTAISLTQSNERVGKGKPSNSPVAPNPLDLLPGKHNQPEVQLPSIIDEQKQWLEAQKQAKLAADWLVRMANPEGHFVYGYLPALNQPMKQDHYLAQLGAAQMLARAAHFTQDREHAAQATRAVVRFLDDTQVDPTQPQCRQFPPTFGVDRYAASSLLVLAIHELPNPQADLLDKGEQLCAFLAGGTQIFREIVTSRENAGSAFDREQLLTPSAYPGLVLYALMKSQTRKPQPWKVEFVKQALPFCKQAWQKEKHPDLATTWLTAFTEAYLVTKEQPFAEFAFELGDWVSALQYRADQLQFAPWRGGFRGWQQGKPVENQPNIRSAALLSGLVSAARLARQVGDLARFNQYKQACDLGVQYMAQLQYDEANTQHFASSFRRAVLVGGYHTSGEDGNLRLDYTHYALGLMVEYLLYVVPVSQA